MTGPDRCDILGLHTGALGDVILFAHLLNNVRKPGQSIALAAGGEKGRLLHQLGIVDRALGHESLALQELFAQPIHEDLATPCPALRRQLPLCETLISCFAMDDHEAQCRLTATTEARTAHFLPIRPPADWLQRLLEFWADRLGLNGAFAAPPPHEMIWQCPTAMLDEASAAISKLGIDSASPFIAAHIGAGGANKCWPVERFEQWAAKSAAGGEPVIFLLGPAEVERLGETRIAKLQSRWPAMVDPPLPVLAGTLSLASAFVGNDSGPSHLAGALGTPTLALFGPTEASHFAPWGPSVYVISAASMEHIPVQDVLSATRTMRESPPRKRSGL